MQRGRAPGQRQDPIAALDAEMAKSLGEIEQQGGGIEIDDVAGTPARRSVREAEPRRTQSPGRLPSSRTSRVESEPQRDARGRFLPTSDDDEPNMRDVLVDDDDEEEAPPPRRQPARQDERRRSAARTVDDDDDLDDDEDEDFDDDEEEDEDTPARRGLDDADEVEGEDPLGPEGESSDDDEDDEGDRRQRRNQRRNQKQPKLDRETERLVASEVEQRVSRVIQERDALKENETKQRQALAANQEFFRSVLGTDQQLAELKAKALDLRLPQAQRDQAAQMLKAYEGNRQFAGQYQSGLIMFYQQQQAAEDQQAMQQFEQLQGLDPKIVAEGNRAKTLVHTYRTGMQAAEAKLTKQWQERDRKQTREIQSLRAQLAESGVRSGFTRRSNLASASGRRANGRVARPDPMRGVLANQRGIGHGARFAGPTDGVLDALKNGDITLADIGLASTR